MEEFLVKKISELEPVDTLYDGCCMPVVQNDETKKIQYSVLKSKLNDDLDFVKDTNELETSIENLELSDSSQNEAIRDLRNAVRSKVDRDEVLDIIYSGGADYAEVGEWEDGNPNKEDRLYRFVTLKANGRKIAIADSNDQLAGVTTNKAGFVGNAKGYDKNDTTKSIVGIIGVVPVKTNDSTIKANDRVMSDDNGYAVKSTNNLGYRVLEVLENGLLEIVVSVNTDMIQRIKTDVDDINTTIGDIDRALVIMIEEAE